jgi:hypothetical protein
MYLLVENFNQGLDTRRMFLTAKAGSLQRCNNAHITRGGEIEKRMAFETYAFLPSGTFGLQAAGNSLYVFGSGSQPANFPSNLQYQQLAHPTGSANMTKLVYSETFKGQIYAIADFSDGNTYHYYNGNRVTAWDSIVATASTNDAVASTLASLIDADSNYTAVATNEVKATGTLSVTASSAAGTVTGVTMATFPIIPDRITGLSTTSGTADAIRDAINSVTLQAAGTVKVATYTAATGQVTKVVIGTNTIIDSSVATNPTVSNLPISSATLTATGFATALATAINNASYGKIVVSATAVSGSITKILANGVNILATSGTYSSIPGVATGTGATTKMATSIANYINQNTSVSGYYATSSGTTVYVICPPSKTTATGQTLSVTSTGLTLTTANILGNIGYTANNVVNSVATDTVTITAPVSKNTNFNNRTITLTPAGAGAPTFSYTTPLSGGLGLTATTSGNVVTVTAPAGSGSLYNSKILAVTTSGTGIFITPASMSGGAYTQISVTGAANNIKFSYAPTVTGNTYSSTSTLYSSVDFRKSSQTDSSALAKQVTVFIITGTFEPQSAFSIQLTYNNTSPRTFNTTGGSSGISRTARTFNTKIYTTAKSTLFYSDIDNPTSYSYLTNPTAPNGSGAQALSNQDNGFEELQGTGVYQGKMAVLGRRSVQIWSMDADPTKNAILQTLKNIGTFAPRSVVNFGDIDVFFLADNGVRSLRARDASNSATVSDVGTNIDSLIAADIQALLSTSGGEEIKNSAVGVIEPKDGRYWLGMGSKIYVYSYFPTPGIAAWSTYTPGFSTSNFAYSNSRLYVRGVKDDGSEAVYLYGGASGTAYDTSVVDVILPYLDGGKPAHIKTMEAVDMACVGKWQIYVGCDTTSTVKELTSTVEQSTFDLALRIPAVGQGTHIGVQLKTDPAYDGAAIISNFAAHFEINDAG